MCFALLLLVAQPVMATTHLIQPTKADVARTVATIRADARCPAQVQFISVGPADVQKTSILSDTPSAVPTMISVLRDRKTRHVYEVFTAVKTGEVVEWRRLSDVQPMITFDDFDSAAAIVRNNEGWLKGLERRGLKPDDVVIDSWASGIPNSTFPFRIVRCLTYVKSDDVSGLYYDRPVEGLICTVNLDSRRVMELYDRDVAPIPPSMGDFELEYKKAGTTQTPYTIKTNTKKAVKLSGNTISWHGWTFTPLLHAREGLVIHAVSYQDGARNRRIAHRLGLSEMVVPYGDTSQYWYWRAAFDVGEYGVGNLTTPLKSGLDVPENAIALDATFAKPDGEPLEIKRAIGIYERDAGIVWKHADPFVGSNRVRRARELVVTSISTVGNYDYGISYVFSVDGTIRVDIELTGILLAKGVPDVRMNENSPFGQKYGSLVSPNIIAPNHQHFFCFRLDLDIDGTANTVSEMEMWSPPEEENMHGSAIAMDDYEWYFEREAHGSVSMQAARRWKVSSTTTMNALGGRPSYVLMPGANATPYLREHHTLWNRAGFLRHHVWATRFHDAEMYAAGSYPNQNIDPLGLPEFVANNESIRGKDVVLWYTVGITHHPRPEEWPIMNVHSTGFTLEPMGFFDKNPALKLKP